MGKLFGTDGIRGIAGDMLDTALAKRFGQATATYLKAHGCARPRVLIGEDTRISSAMLTAALCAGLCESGADCYTVGVIPTPAVAYLTKEHAFDSGIMISASHNPYLYNGIKLLGRDGLKSSEEWETEIEELILSGEPIPKMRGADIGRIKKDESLTEDYIGHLTASADCSLEGLSVGIDAANGAASAFAERVLSALGATCHTINSSPDGVNINEKCGSTDMAALRKFLLSEGLDCAVAFDGDADRCLALDERGDEVDGDAIMAILALDMRAQGRLHGDTVVGTVMSNYGLERFAEKKRLSLIRTAVGDKYVCDEMIAGGYMLGGEQSGHVIIADKACTGDGMLTAISLLCALKRSGTSLSSLSSVYKKYPQHTVNVEASGEEKELFKTSKRAKELIRSAEAGLRGRGRIVVRPSGTESVIRVMTEGEDENATRGICEELASQIFDLIKKSDR